MLIVRPTAETDLPALSALFAAGFGRPLPPDEWQWKYRQLPGEARSLVAVDSGQLLAHAGSIALPARWPGGEGLAWQLCDFVGRPASLRSAVVAAGRALLADLPRCGEMPWIYGFPSARHLSLGERTFGYRPLPWVAVWEGELPFFTPLGEGGGLEISDRCEGWVEAVWERCGGHGVRRSPAFLLWRYTARPARYYRFYRLRAGAVEGLVVAAFVEDVALLAEVWLPPGADWRQPLRAVAADLRACGFRRWRSWPLPAGVELLRALGLRPNGEEVPRGCRPRPDLPVREVVAAASRLYYPMGDHDLV